MSETIERARRRAYRDRQVAVERRKAHLGRATNAMTHKQLCAFHLGTLKTKSVKITRELEVAGEYLKDIREAQRKIKLFNSLEVIEGQRLWAKGEPRGKLQLVGA